VAEAARLVVMGRIVAAHGVRGWLKVQSYTEPPEGLLEYSHWLLREPGRAPRAVRVVASEFDGHWMRVSLEGIADRDAAARLTGTRLYVERGSLPPPGEEEYYHADLIGLRAEAPDGRPLGTVRAVEDHDAGAFLVIAGPPGPAALRA